VSTTRPVERDERTMAVENVSYRFAFFMLTTLLFYDGAYRSFVHHQSVWDLLAWVFLSYGVAYALQAREKVLARSWVKRVLTIAFVCGAIGAVVGAILAMTRAM
jgi:hypothetical protein